MPAEPRLMPLPFDLFAPGVIANPYPWYRMLRDTSPIHHVPERDIWVLSRFADVRAALLNHRSFSSAEGIAYGRQSTSDMITSDPPEHTRMRKLVNRLFTPRAVALIEARVNAIIDDLLDGVRGGAQVDWVADVAVPLPITVIAEMLGIDVADRAMFKQWSNSILSVIGGDHNAEEWKALDADRSQCIAYLRAVIAERHRSTVVGSDLISVLLEASDGDQLSENEVLTFCMLLLVAGNETTTNAISNGMLAMHEHPDEMALLAKDPSLINAAVEETLRYDAPIQGLFRTLREDVTLPSGSLPTGARVLLLYGSANRDSRTFGDGETFRIARRPTGHVAFGAGIHACVGAALARMELRALAEQISRRRLRILPAGQNRRSENTSTPLTRGLLAMPVVVV